MNSLDDDDDDDDVGSVRSSSKKGFSYSHHQPSDSVDIHHITSLADKDSNLLRLVLAAVLLLLPISISLFSKEDDFSASSFLLMTIPLAALLVKKIFFSNRAHKESVLIIPDFGVQLETHYLRKVVRRVIPIGKILQPVLNECVTPVTCYWSLSLILRGEEELLLVFKELRPPVKILVPIWKALCATVDNEKKPPDESNGY